MNDVTLFVNISFALASLMLMITELIVTIIAKNTYKSPKDYFIMLFSMLAVYVASNLASIIAENFMHDALYTQIFIFIESLSSSLVAIQITSYVLRMCGDVPSRSLIMRTVTLIWSFYVAILIYTQFSDIIYYVSPDNVYHRGPYYPMLLVPPVLIMLINIITTIVYRKRLTRRHFNSFLVYFIAPLLAMIIQMFSYGIMLLIPATALSASILFLSAISDEADRYRQEKEENALKSASIAVLQMRPHFIYNVLTSIYYLIGQDPEKAQQVTLDFTSYLRRNMTAITREKLIPFTEELEHTRAYLAVEQVRFEDSLFVEFDTPHILFKLPPLTLQPIVENAVKHGVDPELGPLTIKVRTEKTEEGTVITVEDNGPGFAEKASDSPGIALSSIKQRLLLICDGSITISSREEGGTIVTIFLPDKKTGKKS